MAEKSVFESAVKTPKTPTNARYKVCETCIHFECDGLGGKGQGECRIAPPIGIPMGGPGGNMAVVAFWPTTRGDRWCSKWEAQPLS